MNQPWWLVIATGPSLTRSDCDTLRGLCKTIAVNNAVFYTPWADILYAGDAAWWKVYAKDIMWFKGERVTHQAYLRTRKFGGDGRFRRFGGNSGHQALQYAVHAGAKRVALIGFDHQRTGGRAHCHVDHKRHNDVDGEMVTLGNAACLDYWVKIMNCSAKDAKRAKIEIINLSRKTALTCFPQVTVEEFVRQC